MGYSDAGLAQVFCLVFLTTCVLGSYLDNPSVQLFRRYLQINTTTETSDLTPAVDFWKELAATQNLPINVYEYTAGYPVVVIKWPGSDPSSDSIMLNSHMDVVTVADDEWTYPPFSAEVTEDGYIWARGTQDMKSVSIQYFEALRKLRENNVTLLRDVYMTLMPDEEVGGMNGMQLFLQSAEFAALNIGIEMDEGVAYDEEYFPIFYRDKDVWQVQVDCYGEGGHSSSFTATNNATATGACMEVINKFTKFREEQYEIAQVATIFRSSKYTGLNLNIIEAGIANNIVPDHVRLVYDMRLSATIDMAQLAEDIEDWVTSSGSNNTVTYILQNPRSPATFYNASNPYWTAIENAASSLNITLVPVTSIGSTDGRYVRINQIPAFGFSPQSNTPSLLHSTDERLHADTFLRGIDIYQEIITNLANIPPSRTAGQNVYWTYDDI